MNAKKINVAIIGCGRMTLRHHAEAVKEIENAEIYAVCDTDPKVIEEAKASVKDDVNYANTKFVLDYKELVNDGNVDAVIIVTPDQVHLEQTAAFLRAGKPVLCEKPMALTAEECIEMMRVEKETNGRLTIGQICRFTPGFIKAKELVDAGRIGELTFVESEYAHNYGNSRGHNDWRLHPDRHIIVGGGCHAIDLLRWIAGDPTEVYGYQNHKNLLDWPTADTCVAIYKFPNDVCGKVFCSSGVKRSYTMRTVLYGTKGTIICDNMSPSIQLFEDAEGKEWWAKPEEIPVEVNNHNATEEVREFLNAIIENKLMPVSSMEGAKTIIIATSSVKAMNEGCPVKIEYPEI